MDAHENRLRAVERKVDKLTNQMARVVEALESIKNQGGGIVGAAEKQGGGEKPESPTDSAPPPTKQRRYA